MSRFSGLQVSDHPRATALIICDRIIIDASTQKRSLIDIFDTVVVPSFPATLPKLCIYIDEARRGEQQ